MQTLFHVCGCFEKKENLLLHLLWTLFNEYVFMWYAGYCIKIFKRKDKVGIISFWQSYFVYVCGCAFICLCVCIRVWFICQFFIWFIYLIRPLEKETLEIWNMKNVNFKMWNLWNIEKKSIKFWIKIVLKSSYLT